jgi:ribosomal protein S18 acetylase RimI-like enzyme
MSEKQNENSLNEEIIESQEESEEDDEVTFTFFVNGEIVSWAKTLIYSYLEEIHTATREKRKGYGGKLLFHIEKIAKAHGVKTMKTRFVDTGRDEAIGFFRNAGYGLKRIENETPGFFEVSKKL